MYNVKCVLVSGTVQGIQLAQERCSNLYPVYKRQGIVPWLSRLFAGLSPQRIRFSYKPGHVGFTVNQIAMAKIFFPTTSVFSASFHQFSILDFHSYITNAI
jgi:hypothetical protein